MVAPSDSAMHPDPEWHVPVAVADVPHLAQPIIVSADADTRVALARRFDILSIDTVSATITIMQKGKRYQLSGQLTASLTQTCIATGEPVPATIDQPVTVIFVPENALDLDAAAEIALNPDDLDVVPFSGAVIDLGEAIAQSVALSIDPYPRSPHADDWLRNHGVLKEEEAGAFGALAGLLGKLKQ